MIKITYPFRRKVPQSNNHQARGKKRERYWMLLFFLGGIIAMGKGSYDAYHALRSFTWPSVEGKIVSSRVDQIKRVGETPTYYPNILYVYSVEGKEYTGDRIFFGQYGTGSPSSAQALTNKYKEGAKVIVYYDPQNPANSLLEKGVRWASFALLFFGLLFAGVGLGGFLLWDTLTGTLNRTDSSSG